MTYQHQIPHQDVLLKMNYNAQMPHHPLEVNVHICNKPKVASRNGTFIQTIKKENTKVKWQTPKYVKYVKTYLTFII